MRGWSLALAAVAGTVLAWVLSWRQPFGLMDEGFQYLLSVAWSRGQSLFGDFQPLYPTGQYAWFGAWMRLLGEELWVLRGARALLGGATAALLAQVLGVAGGGDRALAWALVLAVAACTPASATVLTTAAVLVLGSRLAAGAPDRRWLWACGLAAGALAGWREDSAVLALAAAGIGIWLRRRPAALLTAVLPAACAGFLPWLLVAGPDAGPFAAHAGRRLVFLVERLAEPTRPDPWQPEGGELPASPRELLEQLRPLLLWLPPALYGALALGQWRRWRRGEGVHRPTAAGVLLGCAYLPQFLWERPDLWHFRAHLPVLLTAVALAALALRPRRRLQAAAALVALAVLALGAQLWHAASRSLVPYPCCGGARIGARVRAAPPWAGLDRQPGETLVVLGFAPAWYALESLPPGTPFLSTSERHLRTPALRQGLERDLAAAANRWVIRDLGGEAPAGALEVLEVQYQRRGSWGRWELWEREREGEPGASSKGEPGCSEDPRTQARQQGSDGAVGGVLEQAGSSRSVRSRPEGSGARGICGLSGKQLQPLTNPNETFDRLRSTALPRCTEAVGRRRIG